MSAYRFVAEVFHPGAPNRRSRRVALRLLPGLLAALPALLAPGAAGAHPGALDEYGGHFDKKTGYYHYHRPRADMAKRKRENLAWIEPGRLGELQGTVVKVQRPDAVWVQMAYRPSYQELANILPPSLRDDGEMRVLVWFLHVSPEASAGPGKEFREWFRKKVIYEVDQKVRGKAVSVQFRIPAGGRRLYGMVNLGDENINLWLVLNGWSYYLLTQGENPFDKEFRQAEDLAKKRRVGLWAGRG